MIKGLYFNQDFNRRVEPVEKTTPLDKRMDNPMGKTFVEMIVEAQLENERKKSFHSEKDETKDEGVNENKKIVDLSSSYNMMALLVSSSKKDDKKKK